MKHIIHSRSHTSSINTCLRRIAIALLLTLAGCAAFAMSRPASAQSNSSSPLVTDLSDPGRVGKLRLVVNKSRTVRFRRVYGEALVASSEFADVVPLTDQSLYIIGKKIGTTRLTVLDKDKRLLGVIEIEVTFDIEALKQEFDRGIPGSAIHVRTANGRLLLSGAVPNNLALAKAIEITEQFTAACDSDAGGGGGGQAAKPTEQDKAPAQAGAATLMILSGAQQPKPEAKKCYSNALAVRASQQVMLEVRFVEAQRTAARDLGFGWNAKSARFNGETNTGLAPAVGTFGSLLTSGFPSGSLPFGAFVTKFLASGISADLLVEALEKRGIARRLAEPNLVTLSGETANFLAGGEFPIPVQSENNRITIEYKKFGVGLAFTPTVLADRQINLKIEPEVSDLDPLNAVSSISGILIPALVVRRANTTVELRDGQSFAIAGLLQTRHKKNQNQIPWLGDVPVLGALFRSASYEKEESDLVIIVTPRLVRPAVPGQKLATPLDQRVASNDADFFLRGKQEIPRHEPAQSGHILESRPDWTAVTTPRIVK